MSTVGKLLLHLDDNRIKNIKKVKKYVDKYENGIPSFSLTRCVLSRYEECKTLELIEILLDLGADPNECTLFDEHFIQIAIKSGYSEQFILNIVRLSLKHNLDVNYVNKYGVNIIQSAIEKGFKPDSVIEMFKMFEKKDFDLILKQKTLKVFIYSNDNQNKKVEKFLESVDEGLQKSENISGKTNNMVMTIPKTVINEMERFGQFLSKSKYQFNPTIGREKELENVILSLAQDKKCPILVGESGVGKSSIVHELSYRITNKYVPKFLQNLVVFNLDVNSIVAGTKYDGDIQIAVFGGSHPLYILADAVSADVIGISAQLVVIVSSSLGRLVLIKVMELLDHLAGTGHQNAHDLGIEKITVNDAVLLHDALLVSIIHHAAQDTLQLALINHFFCTAAGALLRLIQLEKLQQTVGGIDYVLLGYQTGIYAIGNQFSDVSLYHFILSFLKSNPRPDAKKHPPGEFYPTIINYSSQGPLPISTT